MKKRSGITKTEFAKHLGVTGARVSQLIKLGLPLGKGGKIIELAAAMKWYESRVRRPATLMALNGQGKANSGSLAEARTEREWQKVRREQIELDRLEGKLVDSADVMAEAMETGQYARQSLETFSSRVAPMMSGELAVDPVVLAVVLDRYIRQFLSELADWPSKRAVS